MCTPRESLTGAQMALNRDHRRALRLLAAAPNGATEAIMLAHGFEHALLDDLVLRELATAEQRAMRAGRQPIKVTWLMITDAGRQALRYWLATERSSASCGRVVAGALASSWRRYRARFGSFRHPKGEDGQGHGRGGAGGEKCGAVSEMIDDHAGSQPARRGTDPLGRSDGALG
jgi:hypothetical protein